MENKVITKNSNKKTVKSEKKQVLLVIIVHKGFENEVIKIANENGHTGATIINSRSANANGASFMGMEVSEEQELLLIVSPEDNALITCNQIAQKFGINTDAKGVCFTIPLETVSQKQT